MYKRGVAFREVGRAEDAREKAVNYLTLRERGVIHASPKKINALFDYLELSKSASSRWYCCAEAVKKIVQDERYSENRFLKAGDVPCRASSFDNNEIN